MERQKGIIIMTSYNEVFRRYYLLACFNIIPVKWEHFVTIK